MMYDVIVIGGGPGGLAAAISAHENGAHVLLIEREARLGGMLKQCIHDGFGLARFGERLAGPEYVERFIDRLEQLQIEARTQTFVTRVEKTSGGFAVCTVSRNGVARDETRTLVLATGCRERTAKQVFIHGTRPAGVFTAGTAASPAKAAIRAVTEIAQLGGDFCTQACYEASGLSKFERLEDIQWLLKGPVCRLFDLPSVEAPDIRDELLRALHDLEPVQVYAVETTHPDLGVPAHYCIAPGLSFRERDRNQSIGLFVGRKLAEEADEETALHGLAVLERCYPGAHFLPFFRAMLALRAERFEEARDLFSQARPLQPENDAKGLAAFYEGYVSTLTGDWESALSPLRDAVALCPDMKEYGNLLGVCLFKLKRYEEAAAAFRAVLKVDKGSVMDLANLGLCEKFLGQKEAAMEHLAAALEVDPSLDFARTHLEELKASL